MSGEVDEYMCQGCKRHYPNNDCAWFGPDGFHCANCFAGIAIKSTGPASGYIAPMADKIAETCDAIKVMLLEKNKAYGNSATEPVRIFSSASSDEQLLVRIDDKLSRIARGKEMGEDVIDDLIGYLVLLKIVRGK